MASRPKQTTIALVGIDGAGKTTQATRITRWLTESDIHARYRRAVTGRRVLNKTAHRLGKTDSIDLLGKSLALKIETLLRHANLSIGLPAPVVVADRYHICQYARARMISPELEPWVRNRLGRLPEPDIILYFEVKPQTAHERVEIRGIDSEDVNELTKLDAAYRALPESTRYIYIDAEADSESVTEMVKKEIRSALPALFEDKA